MTKPNPGMVRCSNCVHGGSLSGVWCPHGQRVQRRRTPLHCEAFEDRSLPRPAKPMTCAACGRSEPWLPNRSGVALHPECVDTPVALAIIADRAEQVVKRRQQREAARVRSGIQAQAAGMVRCTDCIRSPGKGTWCPAGKLHANGSWRRCGHWTDQAEPVPAPPPAPLADPAEILEQLRAHPAVLFAEPIEAGIMLRMRKHTGEAQRAEVAVIVGGRAER